MSICTFGLLENIRKYFVAHKTTHLECAKVNNSTSFIIASQNNVIRSFVGHECDKLILSVAEFSQFHKLHRHRWGETACYFTVTNSNSNLKREMFPTSTKHSNDCSAFAIYVEQITHFSVRSRCLHVRNDDDIFFAAIANVCSDEIASVLWMSYSRSCSVAGVSIRHNSL